MNRDNAINWEEENQADREFIRQNSEKKKKKENESISSPLLIF